MSDGAIALTGIGIAALAAGFIYFWLEGRKDGAIRRELAETTRDLDAASRVAEVQAHSSDSRADRIVSLQDGRREL